MLATSDTVVQLLCSTPMSRLSGLLRTNMAKPGYLHFLVTSFLNFFLSGMELGVGAIGLEFAQQ